MPHTKSSSFTQLNWASIVTSPDRTVIEIEPPSGERLASTIHTATAAVRGLQSINSPAGSVTFSRARNQTVIEIEPPSAQRSASPIEAISSVLPDMPPINPPAGTSRLQRGSRQTEWVFPRDLPTLQVALDKQKNREIHVDDLAKVLQAVRFHPLGENASTSVPSNRQLVNNISNAQLKDWYHALSINDAQIDGMESAAHKAGLWVPTSGTVFNAISYFVIPFATQTMTPWNAAFAGLGVIAAQPFITAPIQSLVIGAIDYFRRTGNIDVKVDKCAINSSVTQSQIRENIQKSIKTAQESEQKIKSFLGDRKLIDNDGQIDLEKLANSGLSPQETQGFIADCEKHLENQLVLCGHASQMHAVDGSHARQIESTLWQIPTRGMRSGSSLFSPIFRERGKYAPASFFDGIHAKIPSSYGVSGVSAAVALLAIIAQHRAAARDEVNGLRHEHKLNMLHADMFVDGAKDKIARTGKIDAQDIDVEKCRRMVVLPEASMVLRVVDRLAAELKNLEAQQARKKGAQTRESLAEMGGQAAGDPVLQTRIDDYKRDLTNLRKLDVNDDMHPDTKALLESAMNGAKLFALREGYAKLTKPLELSAQVSQRLGQTFTFGAFGSAGATAGARMISASQGGNDHIALAAQFYLAVASFMIGLFSAGTQGMVTNVKNQRRDADSRDAIGFWQQFGKGALAPALYVYDNWWQSNQGLQEAGKAFVDFKTQAEQMGPMLEILRKMDTGGTVAQSDHAGGAHIRTHV
ncbi:hypothetical protein [Paraburkholderia humisilvae]|uniref:Uncharacterized protein n=1 Tax=Paraburkholderia humisilvae TaxID=627669 RepID=A0A6J5FBR5_9BURK|nr:hypothetical protein [Paraburkholderia humisilvae]CAB3774897.1 hypothetical protein LMG29542_08279 [Paraburkholderia humisilvae]